MSFVVKSSTESLESVAGISFAADIARSCGLECLLPRQPGMNASLLSMFGLLVQGRSSFEEVALCKHCVLFKKAFELPFMPARETLRLYLEKAALSSGILDRLKDANFRLLRQTSLTQVTVEETRTYLPADIDVSPMNNSDSHKEGVRRTYQGYDGYAPIFTYLGAEGYMLDCELRPGSQHPQKGTPLFLMHQLSGPARFFIIKHNLRRENREVWAVNAKVFGTATTPFPGTTVWTGSITKQHPKADDDSLALDLVFKFTERTVDKDGKLLLVPETDLETWWTNLYESPETIIALCHDHGTSEQFHSELKSDLGVERLLSGKMRVNALVLTLVMLAFNTLRWSGQSALDTGNLVPIKLDPDNPPLRKRLRTVISDLIMIGCNLDSRKIIPRKK